jgi:hypothetical protein
MEDPKIKAYGFLATVEFIRNNYDEAAKRRIFGSISPEASSFMETAKKAQWAPPRYSGELWTAMVKEHPNADDAYKQLVKCGRYQGEYATNTYLRIVMKMLPMKLFAKKHPDIWAKDANFGKLVVQDGGIEKGELGVIMKELGKFPYFGPICCGWYSFSFEAMGLKNLRVRLENWSMDNPDPGELTFRVAWTP